MLSNSSKKTESSLTDVMAKHMPQILREIERMTAAITDIHESSKVSRSIHDRENFNAVVIDAVADVMCSIENASYKLAHNRDQQPDVYPVLADHIINKLVKVVQPTVQGVERAELDLDEILQKLESDKP